MSSREIHIIGAGSTGLSAAFFLAQKGLHPVIYEKRPERKKISKALGINPNTLSLFEGTGITERYLANGWKCSCMNIWSGDRLVYRNDFSKVRHKYPFMLIQAQHETESIIEEALSARGIFVHREFTLEKVTAAPGSTTLQFLKSGHSETRVTTMPVIAADGSHSLAREQCGIYFRGYEHKEDFRLIDVELETPLTDREGHYRIFQDGGMLMLHIRDGVWRLAGTVENLLDYLPRGTQTGKVHWEATFRVGEKVADRFNLNNVFLLGDAAHIHSPAGARGMNTCIEDSHIFANLAAEGREQEFHELRHHDIRRMVGLLGQLTDTIAGQNFLGRSVRKNFHLFSSLFPLFMPTMRKFLLGIR